MALNLPTIIEYLSGGDVAPDFETARAEVTTFLDSSSEPTATLTTPAALALAAGSDADLRALLWMLACGINDETVPLGGFVYMGAVGGVTPTLLVRRVAT